MNDLLSRLDRLITVISDGAYPDDATELKHFRRAVEDLLLLADAAKHDGVRAEMERLKEEVNDINTRLHNEDSRTLPDPLRDRLIDKRTLYEEQIDRFSGAEKALEEAERRIREQEQHLSSFLPPEPTAQTS